MKRQKRLNRTILILLISVCLTLVLWQCSKYKEEAPFFDGLFLEYRYGGLRTIYNVQVLEDHKFRIVETEKSRIMPDRVQELYVDTHGRFYKSSKKGDSGAFSPIWLPVHEMKIGETFDGDNAVVKKDKWKIWDVLVIKNPLYNAEGYYDLNTGYLVGGSARSATGTSGEEVLVNTNASTLGVENDTNKEGNKPDGNNY